MTEQKSKGITPEEEREIREFQNVYFYLRGILSFVDNVPVPDDEWEEKREMARQCILSLKDLCKEVTDCLQKLYPNFSILFSCPKPPLPGGGPIKFPDVWEKIMAGCPQAELPGSGSPETRKKAEISMGCPKPDLPGSGPI